MSSTRGASKNQWRLEEVSLRRHFGNPSFLWGELKHQKVYILWYSRGWSHGYRRWQGLEWKDVETRPSGYRWLLCYCDMRSGKQMDSLRFLIAYEFNEYRVIYGPRRTSWRRQERSKMIYADAKDTNTYLIAVPLRRKRTDVFPATFFWALLLRIRQSRSELLILLEE